MLNKITKEKISAGMKKAHAEGRAHNIGQSRWNNKPSYPEQWFMKVIETEFGDKNYIREFPFYKYSLDFAWPNKKFCVEIDGEQHYRQTNDGILQQKRDFEKDVLLKANGWFEIRIAWSTICLNAKDFIAFVKNALDKAELKDIKDEPWYKSWKKENYCQACGKPISYGSSLCVECSAKKKRIVQRPDRLTLAADIYNSSFQAVGTKYNVSANAVIKWCKFYDLPVHIFELKNWYRKNILHLPEIIKHKTIEHEQYIVQQFDKKTKQLINEYHSYAEAAAACNITIDNISRACRGLRKSAGGYLWARINK